MKLMTGREYLSKIRRKASESPWHTRATRSAELFIRVPAKALIVALGRLVIRVKKRFQPQNPRLKNLFRIYDLAGYRGGGDDVRGGPVELAWAAATRKISMLRADRHRCRGRRGTRTGVDARSTRRIDQPRARALEEFDVST